ncbi:MAG: Hsp20/alpha crystallin family protein [Deltaproteobacteria bacterium]|nr:Hsp20/alpha crystallin family protein [Deltaproteobacteria bacterium]
MDAFTRDNHYVIRIDMPGVDPEDLDIQVEGRVLSIKGERKGEEKGHYLRETFRGKFERTVRLPEGLATDKLEARYKNGVIEISVPLPAQAVGRKVPVHIDAAEAKAVDAAGA